VNPQNGAALALPQRRWDIDWLRVLVVLMLVPYHTARIFDYDPFYVKNHQLVVELSYWFVNLGDAFAMRLLFLLAGAATWFALRRRSSGRYALERVQRLLMPFIWGLFVLAPPNAYFALLNHTDYGGSYLEFYPRFFEIGPQGLLDFSGRFTIAHLWFILFLFIISLVALLPIFFLRRDSGRRLIGGLASFCGLPGVIFLLAIPPLVTEWLMLTVPSLFLVLGLTFYFIFFLYGYVQMADGRFDEAIDKHKAIALMLGPVLYVILGLVQTYAVMPDWLQFVYYHGLFPWFTIIAVLGYGKRFLTFGDGRSLSDKFLIYFGEASYPFYLLHQTVLVAIGFYVVQWGAGVLVKYMVIATATLVTTTLLYEVLVRRRNVIRFLFGMRPKTTMPKAPAALETES
jgi:glucan biosynthesis protein C